MRVVGCWSVAVLLVLCAARPALGVEVYFNGVPVTGLKNQSFDNCIVRFDERGHVHIVAPGYTIKQLPDNAPSAPARTAAPPAAPVGKQYFLFSRSNHAEQAQYDIAVVINGSPLRTIKSTDAQVIMNITPKLRPGRNLVRFNALKRYGGKPRLSRSAGDYSEVMVGLGTATGSAVRITVPLATFRAGADTTEDLSSTQPVLVE